jgi:hypothetical protein
MFYLNLSEELEIRLPVLAPDNIASKLGDSAMFHFKKNPLAKKARFFVKFCEDSRLETARLREAPTGERLRQFQINSGYSHSTRSRSPRRASQ